MNFDAAKYVKLRKASLEWRERETESWGERERGRNWMFLREREGEGGGKREREGNRPRMWERETIL